MLYGIDPLLGPECLATLRAMGHGDELVLTDANFPSTACARRLLRADGIPVIPMLRAVLSVLPVDDFEPEALVAMQQVGDSDAVPEAVAEMRAVAREMLGDTWVITTIDRFDFYERAKRAYAVIATGERRLYGNLLIRKGVVPAPRRAGP